MKEGTVFQSSRLGWVSAQITASNNYALSNGQGAGGRIGTECVVFSTRYLAVISGFLVTNPVVTMPSSITNETIETYRYFRVNNKGVFDTFGTMPIGTTEGQNYIGSGSSIGPIVYSGTLGSWNPDTVSTPWAADPPATNDIDYQRGFIMAGWHMVAIHTNWMTKY
jgi:hypothetical protein